MQFNFERVVACCIFLVMKVVVLWHARNAQISSVKGVLGSEGKSMSTFAYYDIITFELSVHIMISITFELPVIANPSFTTTCLRGV
jgi:hypothetical protein